MKLHLLLASAGLYVPTDDPQTEITSIVFRLKDVTRGSLFVCIRGSRYDTHADAVSAAKCGAVTVGQFPGDGIHIITKDTRKAAGKLLSAFYGHPSSAIGFTGITGTNGKTTTAYLLYQIAGRCGKNAGLIGTLGAFYAEKSKELERTTPEPQVLWPLLSDMKHHAVNAVVMEVSSQALSQQRTEGISFGLGVFLNLTRDHLDYHADMEDYFAAKCQLFAQCQKALINIDDAYGRRLAALLRDKIPVFTFSAEREADYRIRLHAEGLQGTTFTISDCKAETEDSFFTPLIGEMSALDAAVAVIAAKLSYGISFAKSAPVLREVDTVCGRCERVKLDAPFTVLIDYAHTPDALHRLFDTLSRYKGTGRLIAVYGCGGERDLGKRPMMAAAGAKADILILTSDNPRGEDPQKILNDMKKGLLLTGKCCTIYNRIDAVRYALSIARENDIIALCGKGHETYQIVGTEKIPMDERKLVIDGYHA